MGTFDGVHKGHKVIIDRLRQIASRFNGESVVLTFYPHPRMVLQPDNDMRLLTTIAEKKVLLEKAGIDHLIIHPFDKKFSRLSSIEFVRDILVNQIGTKKLVIGYDHHFGRNREGSFEHLSEFGPIYGFDVEEIPAQEVDEVNVSSTKIRRALNHGEIEIAKAYLGYSYFLHGKVVHGDKLGRKLGFPTANIEVDNSYKLIPANGIYSVMVERKGQEFPGMANIGTRPTITGSNGLLKLEVNLFDFSDDLYDEELKVTFLEYIREEKKFDSTEELIEAMKEDEKRVRSFFE